MCVRVCTRVHPFCRSTFIRRLRATRFRPWAIFALTVTRLSSRLCIRELCRELDIGSLRVFTSDQLGVGGERPAIPFTDHIRSVPGLKLHVARSAARRVHLIVVLSLCVASPRRLSKKRSRPGEEKSIPRVLKGYDIAFRDNNVAQWRFVKDWVFIKSPIDSV